MPQFAFLDRIEFNERFRYGDVASEIAFLVMELDAAGRYDLARAFVNAYIDASGDEALRELLPFYCCYRACVRGKVSSFQLDEQEVPAAQQEVARQTAASLFLLAAHYASGPTTPTLVMIGGLMGTGKSTLAHALQREMGGGAFSSDILRKQLTHMNSAQPFPHAFGQGIYSPDWTDRTYEALRVKAKEALGLDRSVLLDASFRHRQYRQVMIQEAKAAGATVLFIECTCPPSVALHRLAERWEKRVEGPMEPEAVQASDGRPDLYAAQQAQWESVTAEEEQAIQHLIIDTTFPLALNIERILQTLSLPHLASRL